MVAMRPAPQDAQLAERPPPPQHPPMESSRGDPHALSRKSAMSDMRLPHLK
jgi:hypothetical protein